MEEFGNKLLHWARRHREWDVDLLRIYLGIVLLVQGIIFISDTSSIAGQTGIFGGGTFGQYNYASFFVAHIIAITHLCGGLLLLLGLMTRIAALIQLPILFGAVFIVHFSAGMFTADPSLKFAALVLAALLVVFIHGPGMLSLDWYLRHHQPEERYEAERGRQLSPVAD
jgi:uncharacterized membrane protein YphA (DoxX/SURF4 family)